MKKRIKKSTPINIQVQVLKEDGSIDINLTKICNFAHTYGQTPEKILNMIIEQKRKSK